MTIKLNGLKNKFLCVWFLPRVKIMPPNENDTICQTLSTCITGPLQQARNVTPTSAPISTISISTVNPSPSPERIARVSHSYLNNISNNNYGLVSFQMQCMNKWSCENARLRNICVSDGHTYPTRCHMRRQECIYNVDLDVVHRGECMG